MVLDELKFEVAQLSKLDKLDFLRFVADSITKEEISDIEKTILLQRKSDINDKRSEFVPSEQVNASLIKKYEL